MPAAIDITGLKFNRLTAVKRVPRGRRGYWLFRCDCGGTIACEPGAVKKGAIKSCGCWKREVTRPALAGRARSEGGAVRVSSR
jgi:hypothetical protein